MATSLRLMPEGAELCQPCRRIDIEGLLSETGQVHAKDTGSNECELCEWILFYATGG